MKRAMNKIKSKLQLAPGDVRDPDCEVDINQTMTRPNSDHVCLLHIKLHIKLELRFILCE